MTQTEMQALVAALKTLGVAGGKAKTKGRKAKKAKGRGRQKLTEAERAIYMAKNDAEAVTAFAAKGYKDVTPRVNVLTYDKWIAAGRMVRKGEKSTQVGPFRLFHKDQTDPLPVAPVAGAPVGADAEIPF